MNDHWVKREQEKKILSKYKKNIIGIIITRLLTINDNCLASAFIRSSYSCSKLVEPRM